MGYKEEWVPNAEEARRFSEVTCDNCNERLMPAFPAVVDDEGRWRYLQAQDALHIFLSGGYGEYIDPVASGAEPRLLFCKECAYKLRLEFPSIDRAIKASWDY